MKLVAGVVAAAMLLGVGACTSAPDGPAPAAVDAGPGSPADPASPAAVRWGAAPVPDDSVTLQPDVVLVGGGGRSIRASTADGLTYYLDPAAPRAGELARGKVMFLTSRAVGRVLDVRRAGPDLAVTIGPVTITEVIRDGRFETTAPVEVSRALAYPQDPSSAVVTDPGASLEPGPSNFLRRTDLPAPEPPPAAPLPPLPAVPAGPGQPALPAVPGRIPSIPPTFADKMNPIDSSGMKLVPACCAGSAGVKFAYDQDGLRMVGYVGLELPKMNVGFKLGISGASVVEAGLAISASSGLKVQFEAARADTRRQLDVRVAVPVPFSIPVGTFAGIPLNLVVNQWVVIKTAFSATGTYLKGSGEYEFGAGLSISYGAGGWKTDLPTSFAVKQSLVKSIGGISVGAAGLVLAYQARFLVGIGVGGFAAGVYIGLVASASVTRGSDAGLFVPGTGGTTRVVCRGATLTVSANYGVGYSIPEPVAAVVNFFLRAFRSRPIKAADGIGDQVALIQKGQVDPDVKICGGKGDA